jgi:hypothetical protein
LEWLGIGETAFNFVLDGIRNKDIWVRNKYWRWDRKVSLIPKDDAKKDYDLFKKFTKTKKY